MDFKIATQNYSYENAFDFKGRASRWEYWGGSIGFLIASFLGVFLVSFISETLAYVVLLPILYLWGVITGLSCAIRRLHDVGKSGWNYLWIFTYIGIFYLLYLFVQPSQQQDNEWGFPPEHTIINNEI